MSDPVQLPAMQTHCIGRYLIDIPAGFDLSEGSDLQLYYGLGKDFDTVGVHSLRKTGSKPSLKDLFDEDVGHLEKSQHFKSSSKNMLQATKESDDRTFIVQAYSGPRSTDSLNVRLYAERGESIIKLEGKKYGNEPPSALEAIQARLLKIASNTRHATTPAEVKSGTCLGNAVIDDSQDGEVFTLYFESDKHPDIVISIDMSSLPKTGDGGLLRRVDNNAGMLRMLDVSSSTLRRGKRTMAGRQGEELLDAGKERDRVVRLFAAETLVTEPSSLTRPVVAVSMRMGGQIEGGAYVDASLSEREAMAWWDAIVGSIRIR